MAKFKRLYDANPNEYPRVRLHELSGKREFRPFLNGAISETNTIGKWFDLNYVKAYADYSVNDINIYYNLLQF